MKFQTADTRKNLQEFDQAKKRNIFIIIWKKKHRIKEVHRSHTHNEFDIGIVFIKNGLKKKVPENYHQKTINHLTKDDYENNNTRQNIVANEEKKK